MVLETGELESMVQGPTEELLNLATENEMLLDGQNVPVLFTDNHVLHIQEHAAVASDPVIRTNPQQFALIAQHLNDHISMLSNPAYQSFRQLTNQPTLPPPQPAGGMPQAAPQGPGPAATTMNAAGGPQAMAPTNTAPLGNQQVQSMAAAVKMPAAPINPMTHQRAPLARGMS
jgi:hypothetical protein